MAQWYQAREPFSIDMPDGSLRSVGVGDVLSAKDAIVKHDLANGGKLFAPLDAGEDDAPRPRARKAAS
jgi:hypothetical protein